MKFYSYLLAIGLGAASVSSFAANASTATPRSTPLFFIEDAPNRFLIQVPGTSVVFTPDGVEFHTGGEVVREKFRGAKDAPQMTGVEPMGRANFMRGQDASAWRLGLPTYRKVGYADLYPGVELVYSGSNGRVKSEYRVATGADPGNIQ